MPCQHFLALEHLQLLLLPLLVLKRLCLHLELEADAAALPPVFASVHSPAEMVQHEKPSKDCKLKVDACANPAHLLQ